LTADRVAKFMLGYAGKLHWSESDFQLVTVHGAPGLLLRHPIAGAGTYAFDIFCRPHPRDLRHPEPRQAAEVPRAHALSTGPPRLPRTFAAFIVRASAWPRCRQVEGTGEPSSKAAANQPTCRGVVRARTTDETHGIPPLDRPYQFWSS
jgi:hypothetical protein